MARIRGKIVNPVSIDSKITTEIEAPINTVFATNINYQASSLSTFLETKTALFLPIDLSRIDNIFNLPNPTKYGQSLFRNRQTEQLIPLFFKGNESADAQLQTTVYSVDLL
jgi:hypothetical protein